MFAAVKRRMPFSSTLWPIKNCTLPFVQMKLANTLYLVRAKSRSRSWMWVRSTFMRAFGPRPISGTLMPRVIRRARRSKGSSRLLWSGLFSAAWRFWRTPGSTMSASGRYDAWARKVTETASPKRFSWSYSKYPRTPSPVENPPRTSSACGFFSTSEITTVFLGSGTSWLSSATLTLEKIPKVARFCWVCRTRVAEKTSPTLSAIRFCTRLSFTCERPSMRMATTRTRSPSMTSKRTRARVRSAEYSIEYFTST